MGTRIASHLFKKSQSFGQNVNGETFLARPKNCQNTGTPSEVAQNFQPKYPKVKYLYICNSSPPFWNYDQLAPGFSAKFGIVEKMERELNIRNFFLTLTQTIHEPVFPCKW